MSTPRQLQGDVRRHYGRADLAEVILRALQDAGKDIDNLTLEDLAPVDQFHIRGREATLALANAAGIRSGMSVLDVGCGIGGSSRCLAAEFGCRVTGVDLTDEYLRAAAVLTERVGLSDRIVFRQADATALPFEDATFDIAWSEHAAMNIPDKWRLYEEMYRIVKPGGAIAIHDVLAGSAPVVFPVPWARAPETSFLVSPEKLRELLEAAGFSLESWVDTTDASRAWFVALVERIRSEGFPKLGFHLLLGPDFSVMAQNQGRNLQEGRIVLAEVVGRK